MAKNDPNHPFRKFSAWYEEAQAHSGVHDASAMTLATATRHGTVSARMVLLKALDMEGFVFYTNMNSRKSEQLRENQNAALNFYWQPIGKQIRIEGICEPVSEKEADDYFATRPHGSQIGAWASDQSHEIESRDALKAKFAKLEEEYESKDVPRPPYWSGWRLIPSRMEFWLEKSNRLHHRELFTQSSEGWEMVILQP